MSGFGSVSKAERVSQQLLEEMITSGILPGNSIGTEADLLERFKVSRPTLRESLRILESQGVLELRPGPGGGVIVTKPSIDILIRILSVFMRLHEVPFISLLKAREVIEPALAAEAALNGSGLDFDDLQASIDRMVSIKDQNAFLEENRVFHSIIARAGGNQVLETFWATISGLATGEHQGVRYSVSNQQHVIEAHRDILKACRARDGRAAAKKMEDHVVELERLVRKRYQNLVGRPVGVIDKKRLG